MNTHTSNFPLQRDSLIGKVKWFNSAKGFGFIVAPDFDDDFLLHQHVLQSYGRSSIADGTSVEFSYERSPTGFKISEILNVHTSEENAGDSAPIEPDHLASDFVPARVKWFDQTKGYGFVNQFECSEDVFIGTSVLNSCGLQNVATGEAICIQIAEKDGRKSVYRVQDWTLARL